VKPIEKSLEEPRTFQLLTSLSPSEFIILLQTFDDLCVGYFRKHDFQGKSRLLPKDKEDARSSLPSSSRKLYFLLEYLKENPTQSYHADKYHMTQSKVSQWLKCLLPLLEQALILMHFAPKRQGWAMLGVLEALVGQVIYVDATEREIPRSVSSERQELEYSGKAGYHTLKNTLITSQKGIILYLGDTYEGTVHDKKMLDEAQIPFLNEIAVLLDLGYVGFDATNAQLMMPCKKPKNGELTQEEKKINQYLAHLRVPVEHHISSVKRLRIVKEKIRLKGDQNRDRVMLIACALHNFRTTHRKKNMKNLS
jgi:DDE superfamily endonuclease